MKDNINPDHYKQGNIECIDAIQASMTKTQFIGYLKGNIYKYLWRFENKHKDNPNQDLNKASWYLNRLIKITDEDTNT